MRSKEKIAEEIVLIRYYNVLFYLFFKTGMDDFKRQCLIKRIDDGESMRMKHRYISGSLQFTERCGRAKLGKPAVWTQFFLPAGSLQQSRGGTVSTGNG